MKFALKKKKSRLSAYNSVKFVRKINDIKKNKKENPGKKINNLWTICGDFQVDCRQQQRKSLPAG